MSSSRASRYELDRALLGLVSADDLSAEDRARLDALRAADAERARMAPPHWLTGLGAAPLVSPRRWMPRLGTLSWVFAPTAAMLIAVAISPGSSWVAPEGSTRAKGTSRVDLVVRREGELFVFDGRPLRTNDTLAFRYSSTRRYLVLAGREDGGPLSVFAALHIEPGQSRVAETGVRLDDYRGGEWFYALLSEEAMGSSEAIALIEGGSELGDGVELFRFRVQREAP